MDVITKKQILERIGRVYEKASEMQEVVYDEITDFKQLQSFCNEELISANNTKIGFGHANN